MTAKLLGLASDAEQGSLRSPGDISRGPMMQAVLQHHLGTAFQLHGREPGVRAGTLKLFLVRHCQSTGGLPESALTERGHAAAAQLADQLILLCPDAIYASPYARAVLTVSPLATRLQTKINLDDRLRERVRSSEEIEDVEVYLRRSFDDENYRAAGGESLKQAAGRGLAALADIRKAGHRCVVVASHRTLIASILRSIDPQFGLAEWRKMVTPDVFSLQFNELRPIALKRFVRLGN